MLWERNAREGFQRRSSLKICAALLFLIFTSTCTILSASIQSINSQYLQSVKIGQDQISAVKFTAKNPAREAKKTSSDPHFDENDTGKPAVFNRGTHPSEGNITAYPRRFNPPLNTTHEDAVNTAERGNAGANTVRANDQGGINTPLDGTQWTAPTTVFTPHVLSLVEFVQKNRKHCSSEAEKKKGLRVDVSVHSSSQISVETSNGGAYIAANLKKGIETKLLDPKKGRLLPRGNVTFRVSNADMNELNNVCCFANSSPRGEYAVFNFQDVKRWARDVEIPKALPWEERSPVPVFRGKARGTRNVLEAGAQDELEENLKGGMTADEAGTIFFNRNAYSKYGHRRLALVHFSKMNPDLVDARISMDTARPMKEFWRNNATNGMHRALPFHEIPEKEYYTRYRTHVVMGGIGAAFRTARILGQTVAVIMQDYPYEEWYLKLMEPFVHYVPLERDLSNLNETLHWVRDNPAEVRRIAENGRVFHDKYLSFDRMSEFYHELVLRLMLCCGSIEGRQSPAGAPEPEPTEGPTRPGRPSRRQRSRAWGPRPRHNARGTRR